MEQLQFKISSALKNIIGKDLINDRYIAIFELVKNSYDAGARKVVIKFENIYSNDAKIIIEDDGCGMSLNDIKNKWLFVAYSEKKIVGDRNKDYRQKIKRKAAGAKGVGRFSCDRLGAKLKMSTKSDKDFKINELIVDWGLFEHNDETEFIEISTEFNYKDNTEHLQNGTKLEISSLREFWTRSELLKLKKSLLKLVNPAFIGEDETEDTFEIEISCPDELPEDSIVISERDKVNGIIKNDVFEKLNIKTICLDVNITKDGEYIVTSLFDRGEFIFEITQKNEYDLLKDIKFKLFFMNRAAKTNFTTTMGIEPVKYGSVFIYKNGFRVYPYGEPGTDLFDIDVRKAQGHSRYLGTRDMMGRIQILGDNEELYETTSRDGGFVKTKTFEQLKECFIYDVQRVLEKYVVQIVAWADINKEKGIMTPIQPNDVTEKIIDQFSLFAKKGEIINIEYGENIISYIDKQKQASLEASLEKMEKIAYKDENKVLQDIAKQIKTKAKTLQRANKEAEKEIVILNKNIATIKNENILREQQNFFLENIANKDIKHLMNGMHLIFTHSETLRKNIKYFVKYLNKNKSYNYEEMIEILLDINSDNLKINKLSEYSIKGNFDLKTMNKKNNILDFVKQYITISKKDDIQINIMAEEKNEYSCYFDASIIGIIIDNIISNSLKAKATNIDIKFNEDKSNIDIIFKDNGKGISKETTSVDILFELGVSTTEGFGIGLYHIKSLIDEMGGKVWINSATKDGFELILRIKK